MTESDKIGRPAGRTPQAGDIYIHLTRGYEAIYRVRETDGRRCTLDLYSFSKGAFGADGENVPVSSLVNGEYYTPAPDDILEIISDADRVFRGELIDGPADELPPPEALATIGTAQLTAMHDRREEMKRRAEMLSLVFRSRKAEMLRELDAKMKVIDGIVHDAERQVSNLHKVLDMAKAYGGQGVRITVAARGSGAPDGTPLSIRQRILFMDEEMAVLGDDCKGLDADDIHLFADWLGEPGHRDIIVPEMKCVVVMKPRRFDKRYTGDFYVNRELNRWNHHSFLVLRNGENVSIAEYDNLCVFGSAVPRKSDYGQIMKEYTDGWHKGDEKYASEATEDIRFRSMQLGSIIQGIVDRTGFFGAPGDIDVLHNTGVSIVFDDEADSLVGTGLTDFPAFISDKARSIRRGSRIVYFGGRDGGEPSRWMHGMTFPAPHSGLYSVDEIDGRLGFRYLPDDEVWDKDEGWHKRTRREGWHYHAGHAINFDDISSEEMAAYLDDRTQRRYYLSIIPLLLELRRNKEAEEKDERLFIDCLLRDESLAGDIDEDKVREAIAWWKNKVIFIRPLSLDDRKAYRMIKSRLAGSCRP